MDEKQPAPDDRGFASAEEIRRTTEEAVVDHHAREAARQGFADEPPAQEAADGAVAR